MYRSLESKQKYTFIVGIIGLVFFLLEFGMPMVAAFTMMPSFVSGTFKLDDPQGAAWWHGSTWFVETQAGQSPSPPVLMRLADGSDKPAAVCRLNGSDYHLLASRDTLWIVSQTQVGHYQVKPGMLVEQPRASLGDISAPFLYNEHPAVVENRPGGTSIQVWRNHAWQQAGTLVLPHEARVSDVRVVVYDKQFVVFCKDGGTLFCHDGLPTADSEWQTVGPVDYNWTAILVDGQPEVFKSSPGRSENPMLGFTQEGDRWVQGFSYPLEFGDTFGTFPRDHGCVAMVQGFPGSYRIVSITNGAEVSDKQYGVGFPQHLMGFIAIGNVLMIATPVLMAWLLGPLMRTHRVTSYVSPTGREVPFAPLWRRGVAQLIDSLIIMAPTLCGYVVMFSKFPNVNPDVMTLGFTLVFGGLGWALVGFLIMTIWEGSNGFSLGKMLMGVRVLGADLRPCGFGRALVRNLLLVVDGFFGFMVGVLVSALTENWQRVGDMAASTVVVEADSVPVEA